MMRAHRARAVAVVSGLLLIVGTFGVLGDDSSADLLARADAAYATRYLLESMTEAVALYEAVLPSLETLPVQSQAHVLNRLSQLCYELPMFSEGHTSEDTALYAEGKDYGFQSLRLNAEFAASEWGGLQVALQYVTDPAAAHWAASNWGLVLEANPVQGLMEQSSVLELFERVLEIQEDFWGGSTASALGSLLIMVPGIMGGNRERGLTLIEDSIEMDPTYLHNHIVLAEYWGFTYNMFGALTGVRDAELIERECAIVLEGEIGDWPFWNRMAKMEAERLLAQLAERTD